MKHAYVDGRIDFRVWEWLVEHVPEEVRAPHFYTSSDAYKSLVQFVCDEVARAKYAAWEECADKRAPDGHFPEGYSHKNPYPDLDAL